jgi:C-terminal processing protease CtpA/Prc
VSRSRLRFVSAAAIVLCLSAQGPSGHVWAQAANCSVVGQNTFVRDALRDIYFWYGQLPDLPPSGYPSPEAYLEAVRYRPLDSSFSYISSKESDTAFFSDSQFIGYGFGTKLVGADEFRIAQVFPDSPASEAGLERGHRILDINGRTIADLVATGELSGAFGPTEIGVITELRLADLRGRERRVTMVKRLVTIPTVSLTRVYGVNGGKVGYVFFRNFVQPSFAALDAAFADLRAAPVSDLILDLRYNGGGLVSVAQHLAGLIGGARTNGQVFTEFFHNDKNAFRNQLLRLDHPPQALELLRLVVITTRSSASASELVVNAMRPYMTVVVIGDTTFGKPVGQYGYDFCEKVLHPVAFTLRNALGQGDYFAGIPPDCAAGDGLERALGDPAEASLAEALHYLKTGTCTGAAAAARAATRRLPLVREAGWQQLVGAH